ncbi:MAG: hypothetical protein O3A92_15520 [Verrucomicrobia bacterium]|nr:hypothetical protein [Verrucomicrobiota bacterium]
MKPTLIGMSVILIAVVSALIFTWNRLQDVESQLSEVGLHKVRIRCVDANDGTILKPMIFGVPAPQADVVAMEQPGELMVFWSGSKGDGDRIGASADGYKTTLLPPNWSDTTNVELQLTRP